MHDKYIVPVRCMHYLFIKHYSIQVCYCCWFEIHQWYCIQSCLLLTKSSVQDKLIFNLHIVWVCCFFLFPNGKYTIYYSHARWKSTYMFWVRQHNVVVGSIQVRLPGIGQLFNTPSTSTRYTLHSIYTSVQIRISYYMIKVFHCHCILIIHNIANSLHTVEKYVFFFMYPILFVL